MEFAQRRRAVPPGTGPTACEVSILVFVEFAQRRMRFAATAWTSDDVSILVFVEFAQRRDEPDYHSGRRLLVSILVFVEFAQRHHDASGGIRWPLRVSILVFVEFAQRRCASQHCGSGVRTGFQSLFLWNSLNGEGAPPQCARRPSVRRVSILVFVEFAQRHQGTGNPADHHPA